MANVHNPDLTEMVAKARETLALAQDLENQAVVDSFLCELLIVQLHQERSGVSFWLGVRTAQELIKIQSAQPGPASREILLKVLGVHESENVSDQDFAEGVFAVVSALVLGTPEPTFISSDSDTKRLG